MLPFSSTFTGHLRGAETLDDAERQQFNGKSPHIFQLRKSCR